MMLSTLPKASDLYIPCCIIFSKLLWRKLLAKRVPEREIFLPIVQSQGSDLGQDLGMNFLWAARVWSQQAIVNTEFMPYLLGQPFCYFISISFTHSSSIFLVFDYYVFGHHFPLNFCGLRTSPSTFLSVFFFIFL